MYSLTLEHKYSIQMNWLKLTITIRQFWFGKCTLKIIVAIVKFIHSQTFIIFVLPSFLSPILVNFRSDHLQDSQYEGILFVSGEIVVIGCLVNWIVLFPGVSNVTSGMGIPTDGEEKVGAQAGGEEKVGTQAGAEVALLMDCSSSDLLAIFIFLQQYFRKTNSISIRITTVKTSPTPK